jgi:hypothetical protein
LHVLAEMLEWADRYVKNRPDSIGSPPREKKPVGREQPAPSR